MSGKKDRLAPAQQKEKPPRVCVLDPLFREDLESWVRTKPKVAGRLLDLMESALRDPFDGIGKPEPLKHLGPNIWSRRLTEEHRMVYAVFDDRIKFLQGAYHY
jgi:toxin YoeB